MTEHYWVTRRNPFTGAGEDVIFETRDDVTTYLVETFYLETGHYYDSGYFDRDWYRLGDFYIEIARAYTEEEMIKMGLLDGAKVDPEIWGYIFPELHG